MRLWEAEPGRGGRLWEETKKSGFLGFGWYGFLEDLRNVDARFYKRLKKAFGEGAERTYRAILSLEKGDVVVIRRSGGSFLHGIGLVASDYERMKLNGIPLHGRRLDPLITVEKEIPYRFGKEPLEPLKDPSRFVEAAKGLLPRELLLYMEKRLDAEALSFKERAMPKNLILYGPPGTGKTYKLKEISTSFKDSVFVTFHPSFSYEEFVEGWRPSKGGFSLRDGILKELVKKIVEDLLGKGNYLKIYGMSRSERKKLFSHSPPYGLLIDEINRGNTASIFGELITLIDEDKRMGEENEVIVTLPYSKEPFSLPPNLHIVATMNTVDRSIANLDAALRRRFHFEEMRPDYELLEKHLEKKGFKKGVVEGVDIPRLLKAINQRIEDLSHRDYVLGHAYFMDAECLNDIIRVIRRKIIPLLGELFLDDWEKIQLVLRRRNWERITTEDLKKIYEG